MADQEENRVWESDNNRQEEQQPELYSKTLILAFAILFSVIFAAVLLFLNLRKLKKSKAAIYVLSFAIGYLIATAIVLQVSGLPPEFTFVANVIGAAILNEFFWNKYIGRDRQFRTRSWVKPTMVALGIVLFFFFLAMGTF